MKRFIIIPLILAVVIGVSVAGYQYSTPVEAQSLQEDPSVEVVPVERKTLVDSVSATGRIEPRAEVEMRFETAGVVTEVLIAPGQYLTAGTILARLKTDELELARRRAEIDLAEAEAALAELYEPAAAEKIASAEAAIASARAKLAAVQAGPDADEITKAAADLRKAEITLKEKQWAYDQVAYQGDVGAMPQANELQQATLDYEKALAEYNLAIEEPTEADIADAQAQLAQARADLADLLKQPSASEVAAKQAAVDRAQIDLEEKTRSLEKAELVAPRDGVVLEVNIEPGERTFDEAADDAAVVIADTSTYLLKMEVDEIDIGRIKQGQLAKITLDAIPDQEFTGHVVDVAPRPVKKEDTANSIVTYEVTITFDAISAGSGLRSGLTANAAIETRRLQDAVVIPNRAIQIDRTDDQPITYVEKLDEQGQMIRVEVELGMRDDSVTEILAGLNEGDEVIIRGQVGPVSGPSL